MILEFHCNKNHLPTLSCAYIYNNHQCCDNGDADATDSLFFCQFYFSVSYPRFWLEQSHGVLPGAWQQMLSQLRYRLHRQTRGELSTLESVLKPDIGIGIRASQCDSAASCYNSKNDLLESYNLLSFGSSCVKGGVQCEGVRGRARLT